MKTTLSYVVESIEDEEKAVVSQHNGSLHLVDRKLLEEIGCWRRGAHFDLVVETTFISRPENEDNEYSRKAKEIDLSFLEEDIEITGVMDETPAKQARDRNTSLQMSRHALEEREALAHGNDPWNPERDLHASLVEKE